MEELFQRAAAYAKARNLTFTGELGAGIHGIVRTAKDNGNFRRFAVKLHRYEEAYFRERSAYLRLAETGITSVRGFNLPQLLHFDDTSRALEISIVARPFVLDFAETWLDEIPDWPDGVRQHEEEKIREHFGERADEVFRVIAALRTLGLFMFDVSPSNVAF